MAGFSLHHFSLAELSGSNETKYTSFERNQLGYKSLKPPEFIPIEETKLRDMLNSSTFLEKEFYLNRLNIQPDRNQIQQPTTSIFKNYPTSSLNNHPTFQIFINDLPYYGISRPSQIHFNIIINLFLTRNEYQTALYWLNQMKIVCRDTPTSIRISHSTLNIFLQYFLRVRDFDRAKIVMTEIEKLSTLKKKDSTTTKTNGNVNNQPTPNTPTLENTLATHTPPRQHSYSILISHLSRANRIKSRIQIQAEIQTMFQNAEIYPGLHVYTTYVKNESRFCKRGRINHTQRILNMVHLIRWRNEGDNEGEGEKRLWAGEEIDMDVAVYQNLMNLYMRKARNPAAVEKIYERMLEKGVEADSKVYDTMVRLYIRIGEFDKALDFLEKFDVVPSSVYSQFINLYINMGLFRESLHILNQMKQKKFLPKATTYAHLIKQSLFQLHNPTLAYKLLCDLLKSGQKVPRRLKKPMLLSMAALDDIPSLVRTMQVLEEVDVSNDTVVGDVFAKTFKRKLTILAGLELPGTYSRMINRKYKRKGNLLKRAKIFEKHVGGGTGEWGRLDLALGGNGDGGLVMGEYDIGQTEISKEDMMEEEEVVVSDKEKKVEELDKAKDDDDEEVFLPFQPLLPSRELPSCNAKGIAEFWCSIADNKYLRGKLTPSMTSRAIFLMKMSNDVEGVGKFEREIWSRLIAYSKRPPIQIINDNDGVDKFNVVQCVDHDFNVKSDVNGVLGYTRLGGWRNYFTKYDHVNVLDRNLGHFRDSQLEIGDMFLDLEDIESDYDENTLPPQRPKNRRIVFNLHPPTLEEFREHVHFLGKFRLWDDAIRDMTVVLFEMRFSSREIEIFVLEVWELFEYWDVPNRKTFKLFWIEHMIPQS